MRFYLKLSSFFGFIKYLKEMKIFSSKTFYKGTFVGIFAISFSLLWPLLFAKSFIGIQEGTINYSLISITIISFLLAQFLSYYQVKININSVDEFSSNSIKKLRESILSLTWAKYKVIDRVYLVDVFMTYFWRIRAGVLQLLSQFIPNILISFFLAVFVVLFFPKLFLIFSILYFITLLIQVISSIKVSVFVDKFHDSWKTQTFNLNKFFDQLLLLKMGRNNKKSESLFMNESEIFIKSNSRVLNSKSSLKILDQSINILAKIIFILFGVFLIKQKEMTWSELIIVFFVLNIIQTKLSTIPTNLLSILDAYFSYLKIIKLFDIKSLHNTVERKSVSKTFNDIQSIKFKSLSISIGEKKLINSIDVNLKKGNLYLVNGINGSGKTTLIETILGMHPAICKQIIVNKNIISSKEYISYKCNFSYVPQEVNLFSSSIRENLLFGNEIEFKSIKEHFLWANQLDEERFIGENGKGLSGGEKKRLVILREIFYPSSLIVFDEPENDLDDASLNFFTKLINELKNDKIIIVVTHSNSFINNLEFKKIL